MENRLESAGAVSYTYDLLGRRISRTYSTSTVYYVYDGPHIIAEYSSTGSVIRKYIYGPGMDNPVAMIRQISGTDHWYYYYADALGSIRLLTDETGDPVESYTYGVYGQPRVMWGAGADGNWLTEDVTTHTVSYITIGNPIMFTGRWWDTTTKLYYYRFRDYSPDLGRFLQTDPAKYIDTMNLYAYCANNPVNWIDPWGLCKDEDDDIANFREENGISDNFGISRTPDGGYWVYYRNPLRRLLGGTKLYRSDGTPVEFIAGYPPPIVPAGGGVPTTAHGATRVAGAAATRGGVLTEAEILAARSAGRMLTQTDGAIVNILEVSQGKFNVSIINPKTGKLITSFRHISQKALGRLMARYGWH